MSIAKFWKNENSLKNICLLLNKQNNLNNYLLVGENIRKTSPNISLIYHLENPSLEALIPQKKWDSEGAQSGSDVI